MGSSRSNCGDKEVLGAGVPGTRLGIWPSDGKDVAKGEGAGLSGGGLGVRITAVVESAAPCVGSERPFSLMWAV